MKIKMIFISLILFVFVNQFASDKNNIDNGSKVITGFETKVGLSNSSSSLKSLNKVMNVDSSSIDAQFGTAISISGEFAAISAPMELINGLEVGSVTIYRKSSDGWKKFQKIIPDEPQFFQQFGMSVCLSNETLFVGSPEYNYGKGKVTVYNYDNNLWVKTQVIEPSNPIRHSNFGFTIDIVNNMAVISTKMANESFNASGFVYLYNNNGSEWVENGILLSSEDNLNDFFGCQVKIVDENHILVSASRGNGKVKESGEVFFYEKTSEGWSVIQVLSLENGVQNGLFGCSIDYADGYLVVGAMGQSVATYYSGDAHLYKIDNLGQWQYEFHFVPNNPFHSDLFGAKVLIDNEFILVGSPKHDGEIVDKYIIVDEDIGCTYIYKKEDSTWNHFGTIIPEDLSKGDHFGRSMAIEGDDIVIGSSLDDAYGRFSGSAYFYDLKVLGIEANSLPESYALFNNYPNPFNPTTIISYSIPEKAKVKIEIFDILGRRVKTLVDEYKDSGNYKIKFNGNDLASGIYIYKITANNFTNSKKMMLLK